MQGKPKPAKPQSGIEVGLPNLQDQIKLINRVTGTATEPELEVWEDIGQFLSDVYVELQSKKEVVIFRPQSRQKRKERPNPDTD